MYHFQCGNEILNWLTRNFPNSPLIKIPSCIYNHIVIIIIIVIVNCYIFYYKILYVVYRASDILRLCVAWKSYNHISRLYYYFNIRTYRGSEKTTT